MEWSWLVAGLLGLLGLWPVVVALRFAQLVHVGPRAPISDAALPFASVILCLRGHDPFLEDCLRGLLQLDYPAYELHIVVDDPDGSLFATVQRHLAATSAPVAHVHKLNRRLSTCGLKCSALLLALDAVKPDSEVVALIDADVVPHGNWLRDLVTPLLQVGVAGSTGQRWFAPTSGHVGTWLRYQWNAASTMLGTYTGLPWGGSLAILSTVARSEETKRQWSLALAEDTLVADLIRGEGRKLALASRVVMINRESCRVSQFFRWAQRQTLIARLYNGFPNWKNMVFTAAFHGAFVAGVLSCLWTSMMGPQSTALILAAGLLVFESGKGIAVLIGEFAVRQAVHRSGRLVRFPAWSRVVVSLGLLPFGSAFAAAIWTSACLSRTIEWRGVDYEVLGPWRIRLLRDRGVGQPREPHQSL